MTWWPLIVGAALAVGMVGWLLRCRFVDCVDCPDGDCPPDDDDAEEVAVLNPALEADLLALYETWGHPPPPRDDQMLEQEAQVWENHGHPDLAARLRAKKTGG